MSDSADISENVVSENTEQSSFRVGSDIPFHLGMGSLSASYVVLILGLLFAAAAYTTWEHIGDALNDPEIRYAIRLSIFSCTVSTILSLWVSVPIGYAMSRWRFPGKVLIDAILDIPVVLPPLVIGLFLLILFQTDAGKSLEWVYVELGTSFYKLLSWVTGRNFRPPTGITYEIPAVILAQFMVACAFAVRTMRVTFDQIPTRFEDVALTLGCSKSRAFWAVIFPQTRRGLLAAGTLAWARSLGEFGPILVFASATRMKTEVLSTTVFLEITTGNLEGAIAVSLIMVSAAMGILVLTRLFGLQRLTL